jgi:hypothetical protein
MDSVRDLVNHVRERSENKFKIAPIVYFDRQVNALPVIIRLGIYVIIIYFNDYNYSVEYRDEYGMHKIPYIMTFKRLYNVVDAVIDNMGAPRDDF